MLEPQSASSAGADPAIPRALGPAATASPYRITFGLVAFCAAKVVALFLVITHHPTSAWIAFFSFDPWLFYQISRPTAQGLGPTITHFATPAKEVWLTIDDGPDPVTTPQVLDLLDRFEAKATFFLIGEKVLLYPALVRDIVHRGHTVGNHTFSHPGSSFWRASPSRVASEIDRCAQAFREAGVSADPWFRPPVGIKNVFLHHCLAARGLKLVMWSARGYDGLRYSIAPLRQVIRRLRPGGIILVHEALKTPTGTIAPIIEPLLVHLKAEGYRCIVPTTGSLRPTRH